MFACLSRCTLEIRPFNICKRFQTLSPPVAAARPSDALRQDETLGRTRVHRRRRAARRRISSCKSARSLLQCCRQAFVCSSPSWTPTSRALCSPAAHILNFTRQSAVVSLESRRSDERRFSAAKIVANSCSEHGPLASRVYGRRARRRSASFYSGWTTMSADERALIRLRFVFALPPPPPPPPPPPSSSPF